LARKKLNKIDGQFNARLIEMLESPAYRVLSLSAHRVMDRICVELAHHGGNDNGRLPVTYEHFQEYGVDRQAIAPAIRELEALGFIEVTQRGRPSAGEFRWPNLFRLTWVNCYSTPNPSHEWRRVATTSDAETLARAARMTKTQKKIPRVESQHCAGGGNPHCRDDSPGLETPPTVPGGETHITSISTGGTTTGSFDVRTYSGSEGEVSRVGR
jgi:DNA-binding transcriptional MocR family regulator